MCQGNGEVTVAHPFLLFSRKTDYTFSSVIYKRISSRSHRIIYLLFVEFIHHFFVSLVIFRAHAEFLFKGLGKDQLVLISNRVGDFFNRFAGAHQRLAALCIL